MNKLPIFEKGESKKISFSPSFNLLEEIVFFITIFSAGIFCFVIFIRLFQLTVVKGEYYRNLSEKNRIKEFLIEAKRGTILDRKGYIIAKNLDVDLEQTIEDIKKNDERLISKRVYEEPEAIASIIGYRQKADETDLKNDNCIYKLKSGDKVGKKGIEKIYDCFLRGQPGKKLIEVDAKGNFLKSLNIIPPIDGKTIQLSIDLELQKKAYQLLKGKKGAIIVNNPKTGEILALISSPTFNPQDFEDESIKVKKYFDDKNKPLFNRATEGLYPPGSIFKLITGVAALEEKTIDEKTEIEDKGIITAGPLKFGNWYFLQYGKTDGMVNIVKAIKRSNDIFFYLVGEKTGVDKIKNWAYIFGYGRKTNIGLEENEGIIPSKFWKKEILKENWYTGDTYNFSIGQGYLTVTPLQTLLTTSVFANNGYLCQPKLLKITNGKWQIEKECKKLPISSKTIKIIKEGMKQACSPGGTGWPLFNFKFQISNFKFQEVQVACKTGTAESKSKDSPPHAWITVFAPYDNPEIALTVLVEEGGQGSDVAGPIAKEILKSYFEK